MKLLVKIFQDIKTFLRSLIKRKENLYTVKIIISFRTRYRRITVT